MDLTKYINPYIILTTSAASLGVGYYIYSKYIKRKKS